MYYTFFKYSKSISFTQNSLLIIVALSIISCKSSLSKKKSVHNSKSIIIDHVDDEIKIDGILNEKVYHRLEKYYLVNSMTGEDVKDHNYQSYFTIHHNHESVFYSFTSFDQNIYSYFKNRDDHLWKEECVEIFIDVDNDPQNYIEIELSPAGVLFDSFIINPDVIDVDSTSDFNLSSIEYVVDVDGSLNDSTDIDTKWTAEISIAVNELDTETNLNNLNWRMNVFRINKDKAAEKYFAYSPTFGKFHKPEKFVNCRFNEK